MSNFTESSNRYLEAKYNLLVIEIDELKLTLSPEDDEIKRASKNIRLIFMNLELTDLENELKARGILQ